MPGARPPNRSERAPVLNAESRGPEPSGSGAYGAFAGELPASSCKDLPVMEASEDLACPALRFMSLLAVVHTVFYYRMKGSSNEPSGIKSISAWGASWISFFFLLLGLEAARTKLLVWTPVCGTSVLPQKLTLLRRLASVYPLYVLAIGLSVLASYGLKREPLRLQELILELSLLQSWGNGALIGRLYNEPGWIVSALAVCVLLEESLFTLAAFFWRRQVLHWALLACAAWVLAWPFAGCPWTWGRQSWNDVSALAYLHAYFLGLLLGFLLSHQWLNSCKNVPLASIAIVKLSVLFYLVDIPEFIDDWGRICPLPFQALLALGLADGHDPATRLLSVWPLPLVSEVAVGVYLLQGPVFNLGNCLNIGWAGLPSNLAHLQVLALLAVLFPLTVVAQFSVQRPLSRAVRVCLGGDAVC